MAAKTSFHRVHCADNLDKHRRRIPQKRNFRSVKDLDISALKRLLGPDNFKKEAVDHLNLGVLLPEVSPLKPPSAVRKRDRPAYAKRKQRELEQAVTKKVRSSLDAAYDAQTASGSTEKKCFTCAEFNHKFRQAFVTATSSRERCQLLTLLPSSLKKNEVQKIIPEASMYLINKSRKLREKHGVWYQPDPYTRQRVSQDCISTAYASGLIAAFLCTPASDNCFLGECDKCPKGESLTLETLNIPEEEDSVVATWESGDLVKKTLDPSAFLRGLRVSLATWIVHNHIRKTQGAAIHNEKKCEQRGSVVFHFDFAENWTVILPDKVQGYHWHKTQVSIFTCVVMTRKNSHSFVVASDDVCHDSAHACLALEKIRLWVDDNLPLYSKVTYVSDGAASLFKNRYQLHELGKSDVPETQWIFSATGHGKNACDGVGGIVKHQATLYNLREPLRNAIQTAKDMVTVLSEKIKGVHFIYLEGNEVSSYRETKKEEWRTVRAFPGIQSWHVWRLRKSSEADICELYAARTVCAPLRKL
ncbi:uncharacterized protein LOC144178508 [Haemaphysalis longicornis]